MVARVQSRPIRPQQLIDIGDQVVVREHHAFGHTRRATRVGKSRESPFGGLLRFGIGTGRRFKQICDRFGSRGRLSRSVDAAKVRQSRQIDALDVSAIGNEENRAGVLQLITHFAFAVSWIEQSRNRAGELYGVKNDAEFPGICEKYGDYLPRPDAGRNQSTRDVFNGLTIFRIGKPATARTVYDRGLLSIAAAGIEHYVVEEQVGWVRVEFSAQHCREDCSEKTERRAMCLSFP